MGVVVVVIVAPVALSLLLSLLFSTGCIFMSCFPFLYAFFPQARYYLFRYFRIFFTMYQRQNTMVRRGFKELIEQNTGSKINGLAAF